jgi:hypothetical protein
VAVADGNVNYASKRIKSTTRGRTRAKIKQVESTQDEEAIADSTDDAANKNVIAKTDDKKLAASPDKIKDSAKTIVSKDTLADSSKKEVAKKETKHKTSKFYVLASIGPDLASVDFFSFNNSTVTARYGVGVGYQLSKKFSIETGFYAGRKEYIAGPYDYHTKQGSYLNMVDITKVGANCLIYDIPITVRYNFYQRAKTTYFATAGLSSFIMKKEDYEYYYVVNNMNRQVGYSYTGNNNLFSICTLSVGIEKKLSNAFSLQAQPSVNIPIAGVGEGTVKLYSTAIQFVIKYNIASLHNK